MAKSRRLELHQQLIDLTGWNVYYQPPENVHMTYPCVVYELEAGRELRADNKSYFYKDRYGVKLIHSDPDSDLPDKMREHFSYSNRGPRYKADNLYHDPFTIYY